MIRTALLLAIALALSSPAMAEDAQLGALKITAAWARATPKGAAVGGGYVTITNTGKESDRLVGGSSDVSNRLEVHEMSMDKGVMKMRPVTDGVEIKPGQTVMLKPGGLHIMFTGLKKPLVQGEHIKGTLTFAKAGNVEVDFSVAGIGAQGPGGMSGGGMKDMKGMH